MHRASPKCWSGYCINTNSRKPLSKPPSESKYGFNPDVHNFKSHVHKGSAAIRKDSNVFSLRKLPQPPLSPISFKSGSHSYKSTDEMKAISCTSKAKSSQSPPSPTFCYVPISNKSLRKPQRSLSPSLDGRVAELPVTTVTSESESPRASGYISMYPYSIRRPRHVIHNKSPNHPLSESHVDSFKTPPTSPGSSSGFFETAPSSFSSVSASSKPVSENRKNILEPCTRLNDSANIHRSTTKPSNLPPGTTIPLGLPQPQQDLDGEIPASDSQSLHRSNSLFSSLFGVQESPPPKDPVHDGSLLTSAIHTAVNEAVAFYESARLDCDGSLSLSEASPFLPPLSLLHPENKTSTDVAKPFLASFTSSTGTPICFGH